MNKRQIQITPINNGYIVSSGPVTADDGKTIRYDAFAFFAADYSDVCKVLMPLLSQLEIVQKDEIVKAK